MSPLPGIGAPGLTVGLISGGINTNVVPDNVTFRIDRRITPDEDAAKAEANLRALIEREAAASPGISCKLRRILLATPFVPMPGQERLVAAIQKAAVGIIGEPVGTKGVPIYTDARLYSAAGIPTVLYGAGPRTLLEANGHRADEKLRLDDLDKATASSRWLWPICCRVESAAPRLVSGIAGLWAAAGLRCHGTFR